MKRILIICLLLLMGAGTAAAKFADFGNVSIIPSLGEAWAGVPGSVQNMITWIVGLCIIALVVIAVIYSSTSGGAALLAGHRGDIAGRSSGISNMLLGVAVIFVAIIAIALIAYLVT